MKKLISTLLVSAMTVMFAVGCAAEEKTPETPVDTGVETPADKPAENEDGPKVTSLIESRKLSADEETSLEKIVKFMRTEKDTIQVSLFEMSEIAGGFNMEFVVKNNFAEKTTIEEGTLIEITTQDEELIEVPVPMTIEIEANAGVLFEAKVMTDLMTKRADIYFIEFKAEEKAE